MKKAYVLYLWLILFTMFVTVFSIILFNYSAGDIKFTRKLMQDTQYYEILKSISLVATEFYRAQQYEGSWSIKRKLYKFKTRRIDPTKIVVEIFDNFNLPIANVIVQDRYALSEMNFLVMDSGDHNDKLTFNDYTTYESFSVFGDAEIYIDSSSKIFNVSHISSKVTVNGKGIEVVKEKDGREYYVYGNLEEMKKYSNYASIIDEQMADYFYRYFQNLRDFVKNKSENSKTKIEEVADLTKYGSILISVPPNLLPSLQINKVGIKFNVNSQQNQEISFDIDLRVNGVSNQFERYTYYLVKQPQTINVVKNSLITNDPSIIPNQNNQNNQNNQDNIIPINLNPPNGFVYKVLIKEDKEGNPLSAIIYKTAYDKTIIYADADVEVGSNSPDSFEGGNIGSTILLITPKNIDIIGHLAYKEFLNLQYFLQLLENKNFEVLNQSQSYLSLVANRIAINPPADYDSLVLNGNYVSFYDANSQTTFNYEASKIYYLGSSIASRRYSQSVGSSFSEKIITDPRENSPLNEYFICFKILSINMLR